MTTPQKAILLPLIGLMVGWSLFMLASFSELFIQPEYDDQGMWLNDGASARASTYLSLGYSCLLGTLHAEPEDDRPPPPRGGS
jgi:hypothetical protein